MQSIVVVEDDAFLRNMLGVWLSSRYPELEVKCFPSAEEAAAAFCAPPALVIMDVRLPGMNGIAAAKSLKDRPDKPPVILISVWSEEEYVKDAKAAGVDAFVPKQSLWRQLLPMADGLLSGCGIKGAVQ